MALWGIAMLLAVLNIALIYEGREAGLRDLALVGGALSWVVLATWWMSGAATTQVTAALAVTGGFALLMLGGQLWMREDADARRSGDTQVGLGLALAAHLFLLVVAAQPALSIPPGPMLGVLAVLDLAVCAAALHTGRAEVHGAALVFSFAVLVTWTLANQAAPWPLVALYSGVGIAAIAAGSSVLARRSVRDAAHRTGFHAATAVALVLGQVLVLVVSMTGGSPGPATLAAFHSVFLLGVLGLASASEWLELAALAAGLAGANAVLWQATHATPEHLTGTLALALPLYLIFLGYPLALGRKIGRSLSPHLAAVLASAWFFHVARMALVSAGYQGVIGALPVVQAALMGVLLAALLRLEPPSERTLGRLALVAAAVLAFVTVAIPLQLDKQWVTIGWALEGAALAWLFRRFRTAGCSGGRWRCWLSSSPASR